MKTSQNILCLLFVACVLSLPTIAHGSDESLGYRYRVTFNINDEIGKATVHVYTNTWVYNPNQRGSYVVWLANPHPDITATGSFSSVLVPGGCTMIVGKGVLIIERPGIIENEVRPHDYLTITQSLTVYDFREKKEMKFEHAECRK